MNLNMNLACLILSLLCIMTVIGFEQSEVVNQDTDNIQNEKCVTVYCPICGWDGRIYSNNCGNIGAKCACSLRPGEDSNPDRTCKCPPDALPCPPKGQTCL